ncbi:MAG: phospholipase D family protein [Bacillus sp. (in: firmicutes)]
MSKKRKKIAGIIFILFVSIYTSTIIYHTMKPLPKGLSFEGDIRKVERVEFLQDLTYKNKNGDRVLHQEIVTSILAEIERAEEFIVMDMFLFNKDNDKDQPYPAITETITKALLKKKEQNPSIKIIFITDKVNTAYSSYFPPEFKKMKDSGIDIIITELDVLRDSNPLYSSLWRMLIQWFGQTGKGTLPNMLAGSAPDVTVRSYLELLNVKANHRKVVITDNAAIISSGNIHDASGYHSNTAFLVEGKIIGDLLKSENSVNKFSGNVVAFPSYTDKQENKKEERVQLLTEGKIAQHLLTDIKNTKENDTIWIAMLYLADRKVVNALKEAAERNVNIRIILDPNQNAFGNKKAGLPNVPVAAELMRQGNPHLQIKWYNTGKEQFHTKMIMIEGEKETSIISGSANFTRRNLYDLNLETDIKIIGSQQSPVIKDVKRYFTDLWENNGGQFTKDYDTEDKLPVLRYIIYRLQRIFWFTTY